MTAKNRTRINLVGLWVFGLLVGANAGDFVPLEPSIHTGVLLAVGLFGSIVMFAGLARAAR